MAFDHKDTDEIYDRAIEPLLRRNDVTPVIIDRKEDNKDINLQIISELDACDFCIADLTYTRPSVYFEAGYAQRQVDVIYTVRSDHLARNQPEDRRVHFDLQMKPLIKWKDPSDKTFQLRLERRLRSTALKAWHRQNRIIGKVIADRENFVSLPVNRRLEIIRRKAVYSAIKKGFNLWSIEASPIAPYGAYRGFFKERKYKNPARYANLNACFHGEQKVGSVLKVTSVTASESITLAVLRDHIAVRFGYNDLIHYFLADSLLKKVAEIEEHHIILSIRNTPDSRIMSAMPYLHKENEPKRFIFRAETEIFRLDIEIPRTVLLYFPSNIDSEVKLNAELDKITSCF